MFYDNFEISIGPRSDRGYAVEARSDTCGETGSLWIDVNIEQLGRALEPIRQRDVTRDQLRDIGTRLYDTLIQTGPLRDLFHRSLGRASDTQRGLRVRLAFEPAEIAALPWEYCYRPDGGTWLSTSVATPLVRYPKIPVNLRSFKVDPPLRMLVVAPLSSGLDVPAEKKRLAKEFEGIRGVCEVDWPTGTVNVDTLSDTLNRQQYHVLHFIGHATLGSEGGTVALDGFDGGPANPVSAESFAELFVNQRELKLVFLNACEAAAVSPTESLVGVAPAFLRKGVPGVVGMQFRVYDDVAIACAGRFYASLFQGTYRGRVDLAITEARNYLAARFGDEKATVRAFGEPVLFLHAPNGLLYLQGSRSPFRWLAYFRRAERELGALAEDTVRSAECEVDDASQRDVARYVTIRKWTHRGILLAAFLVSAHLAANGALNLLGVDAAIRSWVISTTHAWFPLPFSDEVVLITAVGPWHDPAREDPIPYGKEWRRRHQLLIEKLARCGAKVVVLDYFFPSPSPQHDEDLAKAIADARDQRKTHVLILVTEPDDANADDSEPVVPRICEPLREAVSGWGVAHVRHKRQGNEKEIRDLRATIWFYKEDDRGQQVRAIPSLALAAYCRWHDIATQDVETLEGKVRVDGDKRALQVLGAPPLRALYHTRITEKDKSWPPTARPGWWNAQVAYDLTPDANAAPDGPPESPHCWSYSGAEAATDAQLRPHVAGKVVMVGSDDYAEDRYRVRGEDKPRSGVRINADILSTLMNGGGIGRMPPGFETALVILMAAAGSWAAWRWAAAKRRYKLLIVAIGLGLYVLLAAVLYVDTRLLWDFAYPALAFILLFIVAGWSKQQLARGGVL